jgi:hypothetical protein
MSRRLILLLAVVVALFAMAPVVGASHNDTFTASLKGSSENPPTGSQAAGEAIVKLRSGELSFKLIVANIENAAAAHIHCGPVGVNGAVGVTLYSGPPTSDSGILAQGEITEPDPGNGCMWDDLAEVIAAIQSGDTYVNVHTPAFPGGEIRGQLS